MRVTFDLSDSDLKYFRRVMREVREKSKQLSEADIVAASKELLEQMANTSVPEFVRDRVGKLDRLIEMLEDGEWALSGKDRERVVRGLAYFAEPEDMIPDKVPVLGFLDDAIMVELVVSELEHEIEAYGDFCNFRVRRESHFGENEDPATREEWLVSRRRQLQQRMRRRRGRRRHRAGAGSAKGPTALW
jgi:uncharacterized membrane protein YkvA (DUF1232 family)